MWHQRTPCVFARTIPKERLTRVVLLIVEALVAPSILKTAGAEAADRWRASLGLSLTARWFAEIALLADGDARLDLNIYAEEWGFRFARGERSSWIRITDVAFAHGRDDFGLLAAAPDLLATHVLLAELEAEQRITFQRATASVRTNLGDVANVIRDWLLQPPPYSTVKKTTELCGNQMRSGVRCSRSKGHDGDHEYQGHDGRAQLRWK